MILCPDLKRWGPSKQKVSSQTAHLWAAADFVAPCEV